MQWELGGNPALTGAGRLRGERPLGVEVTQLGGEVAVPGGGARRVAGTRLRGRG